MKRKTDFKRMYLVDDTLYNKIHPPQLPTTMIVGRYSHALNSQPIPNEPHIKREVPTPTLHKIMKSNEMVTQDASTTTTPTQTKIMKSSGMMTTSTPPKIMKSSGTMTEYVSTPPKIMKSSGMMTENIAPTTSEQHHINELQEQLHNSQLQVRALETSLRARALPDYTTPQRSLRSVNRTSRMKDYSLRSVNRTPRLNDRTSQSNDRNLQQEDHAMQLDYHTPQLEFRPSQLNDRTMQSHTPQLEPPALQMNTLPTTQQLASGPLTSYSHPMDTSSTPEQLELMDFNTNQALEYTGNNTNQALEYSPSETALALPPVTTVAQPDEDECDECADNPTSIKYVKYNDPGTVALPSVSGLPKMCFLLVFYVTQISKLKKLYKDT